jgi:hypothetical protein
MFWLCYEWGPGNEAFTPWLLVKVIGQSKDDGYFAVLVAAGVGFTFTFVQQLLSGMTALAGFSIFERTATAAWGRLNGEGAKGLRKWDELSFVARGGIAFTLGTTAVALLQIMTTGTVGARRHAGVVVSSAVFCASMVGVLGVVVATLSVLGHSLQSLAGPTDLVMRVLGSPLLWLLLVAALLGTEFVGRRKERSSVISANREGIAD